MDCYLSEEESQRLERLERRLGVGFSGFVRLAIQTLERERTPEATDKVRLVIPDPFARAAQRATTDHAETLMALARRQSRTPDGTARAMGMRQEAGGYYDAAAWFDGVVKRYDLIAQASSPGPASPTTRESADRTAPRPTSVEDT